MDFLRPMPCPWICPPRRSDAAFSRCPEPVLEAKSLLDQVPMVGSNLGLGPEAGPVRFYGNPDLWAKVAEREVKGPKDLRLDIFWESLDSQPLFGFFDQGLKPFQSRFCFFLKAFDRGFLIFYLLEHLFHLFLFGF